MDFDLKGRKTRTFLEIQAIKKNKQYAKDVYKYIKENTELRSNAEKDAELLADTISINQVLTEEIKVKNQIIKANEN